MQMWLPERGYGVLVVTGTLIAFNRFETEDGMIAYCTSKYGMRVTVSLDGMRRYTEKMTTKTYDYSSTASATINTRLGDGTMT